MTRHRDYPATIGRELVAARRAGVPWKVLMRRYDLCRARLNELWRAALDAERGANMSTLVKMDIAALDKPRRSATG